MTKGVQYLVAAYLPSNERACGSLYIWQNNPEISGSTSNTDTLKNIRFIFVIYITLNLYIYILYVYILYCIKVLIFQEGGTARKKLKNTKTASTKEDTVKMVERQL